MAHISNLEQATALDIEKWLQTLPEEAPAYAFSEKYNKFRVKLFDKMRGEKYHRFTKRATIAIIVAAVLLSMTIVTLAATLGKDFIIKHFNGFASVEVSEVEDVKFVDSFELNYIPNGFVLTDNFKSKSNIAYTYNNNTQWFDISKGLIDDYVELDEEENQIERIERNGITYLYTHSSNTNSLLWNDGNFLYDLAGNLTKDELLKIAQGAR